MVVLLPGCGTIDRDGNGDIGRLDKGCSLARAGAAIFAPITLLAKKDQSIQCENNYQTAQKQPKQSRQWNQAKLAMQLITWNNPSFKLFQTSKQRRC